MSPSDKPYLSWSQLKTWERCERQYEARYLERLPSMRPPGGALVGGAAVHAAIEASEAQGLWWHEDAAKDDSDLARVYLELLTAEIDRQGGEGEIQWGGRKTKEFPEGENRLWWERHGLVMLRRQVHLRRTWAAQGWDWHPGGSEMRLFTKLPSGRALQVVIDQFLYTDNGAPALIDYKTGQIGRDLTEGGERQLAAYAWALEGSEAVMTLLGGEPIDRAAFVYLRATDMDKAVQVVDLRPIKPLIPGFFAALESVVESRQPGSFPMRPGQHCGWCSYRPWCQWGQILEAREASDPSAGGPTGESPSEAVAVSSSITRREAIAPAPGLSHQSGADLVPVQAGSREEGRP